MTSTLSRVRARAGDLNLLAFVFLTSLAASGSLPLINQSLKNYELNNSWGFAPYFISILIGQFLLVVSRRLREARYLLSIIMIVFSFSVFVLPAALHLQNPGEFLNAVLLLRMIEGFAVGCGLPLIFQRIVNSQIAETLDGRILYLNLINIIGFIVGVPISEAWPWTTISFLNVCAVLLTVTTILNWLLPASAKPLTSASADMPPVVPATGLAKVGWFQSFYLIFVAKIFYGYLISYLIFQKDLFSVPLFFATVLLAVASGVGQVTIVSLIHRIPLPALELFVPTLFATMSAVLIFSPNLQTLILAFTVQAMLFYLGNRRAASSPENARDYAFLNGLSDPGIVIGALLPLLLLPWSFALLAALGLVPLLRHLLIAPKNSRAEAFFPFVGPLTLAKMFVKHKNPNLDSVSAISTITANWGHRYEKTSGNLRILLAGDMVFHEGQTQFDAVTQEWIRSHDLRLVNLEAPLVERKYDIRTSSFLSSDPKAFAKFNGAPSDPLFNVFNLINNHSLDLGEDAFEKSAQQLRDFGLKTLTKDAQVLEFKGHRIGFLSKTFGYNIFWKARTLQAAALHPLLLHQSDRQQATFETQLKMVVKNSDLTVLSYHWGFESESTPDLIQQDLFTYFQKHGIQLLYGHHAHIPQPLQRSADGKFLGVFSCGNLDVPLPHSIYSVAPLISIEWNPVTKTFENFETRFYFPQAQVFQQIAGPAQLFWRSEDLSQLKS